MSSQGQNGSITGEADSRDRSEQSTRAGTGERQAGWIGVGNVIVMLGRKPLESRACRMKKTQNNVITECECECGASILWLMRRAGVSDEDSRCRCG